MPNRQIAEAEWVDRFLNRLGTIAPSVHTAGANERAFQTYADGEVVQWTGPEGSKRPASATQLTTRSAGGSAAALWVAIAALVIAIAGLGLALRRPEPAVV